MKPGDTESGPFESEEPIGRSSADGRSADADAVERGKHTYFGEYTGDESPGLAVVETIASITGRDPIALSPLYDAVDPDVLDAFCSPRTSSARVRRVRFEYERFEVTVHCDGRIELVSPPA